MISAPMPTPLTERAVSSGGSSLLAERVQEKTSPTCADWKESGRVSSGVMTKSVVSGVVPG
jgi:hypothetical protein